MPLQLTDTELASIARAKLDVAEAIMRAGPTIEVPPVHHFADGLYGRELTIPAGSWIVGKIHRHEHLSIISAGEISVWTEHEGARHLFAPCTIVARPGTRRIGFAHTDTVWTCVHPNPTNETDPERLEEIFIVPHELPPELMAEAIRLVGGAS